MLNEPYILLRAGDYGHLLKVGVATVEGHPILVEITNGPWDNIKELYLALMDKPEAPPLPFVDGK